MSVTAHSPSTPPECPGLADCWGEEFEALYRYSPLHNLKAGVAYPPTLISTADHDDRVFPAHSFKFAAAMQAMQEGENPVLIRVETRAGHGGGMPLSKRVEQFVDQFAFLVRQLEIRQNKC